MLEPITMRVAEECSNTYFRIYHEDQRKKLVKCINEGIIHNFALHKRSFKFGIDFVPNEKSFLEVIQEYDKNGFHIIYNKTQNLIIIHLNIIPQYYQHDYEQMTITPTDKRIISWFISEKKTNDDDDFWYNYFDGTIVRKPKPKKKGFWDWF